MSRPTMNVQIDPAPRFLGDAATPAELRAVLAEANQPTTVAGYVAQAIGCAGVNAPFGPGTGTYREDLASVIVEWAVAGISALTERVAMQAAIGHVGGAASLADTDGIPGISPNDRLRHDVASLLNRYSRENHTGTPDFILADVMVKALTSYEETTIRRDGWWSFEPKIGGTIPARDPHLFAAADGDAAIDLGTRLAELLGLGAGTDQATDEALLDEVTRLQRAARGRAGVISGEPTP